MTKITGVGVYQTGCFFAVLLSSFLYANVVYVNISATGANNGVNWANAYTDLQPALSAAVSGDEIWVAAGTYKPSVAVGGTGDRFKTFQLANGVAIYGGFSGTETNRDERNWQTNSTVLSGDLSGNDNLSLDVTQLLTDPSRSENCLHVVSFQNVDHSLILDGFIITGGNATEQGIFGYSGGGIYTENEPSPTWDCSSEGPVIAHCTLIKNSANGEGGGIYNRYNCSPQIKNCQFIENASQWGGGAIYSDSSTPIIEDCVFQNNIAQDAQAGSGGAIENEGSSPVITRCSFSGNIAAWGGGAVNNWMTDCHPEFYNCLFVGNSARYGGVIRTANNYQPGNNLFFVNCTMTGNSADYGTIAFCEPGRFGAIPSTLSFTNCILWNGTTPFRNADGSTINVTYTDIEGSDSGTGNINIDPLFVNAAGGDLRLQSDSLCIDAGNNAIIPPEITTDLANERRIVDGDCDNNPIIDIGAYEYYQVGELDAACGVNIGDFHYFSQSWLQTGCEKPDNCNQADIDRNGTVELFDLMEFAVHWLDGI